MPKHAEREVWEFGDFQTPQELAVQACKRLHLMGVRPSTVLEPTCGRGSFLVAAAETFPGAQEIVGVDINEQYVEEAREACEGRAKIEHGDFFQTDWSRVFSKDDGPWLVLGNPPWVTNSDLSVLRSKNLPEKNNSRGHRGYDAITGKANFDISESMLMEQTEWLKDQSGWIAMLVKTAVARKVLRQAWKAGIPVGRAAIFNLDAMEHFGAAVEACLFVMPVGLGGASTFCDVYGGLDEARPSATIGFQDGVLVADVTLFERYRHLLGANTEYVWRSGIKHDCATVMELKQTQNGTLVNRLGTSVNVEDHCLYPMLKSSDQGCRVRETRNPHN